MQVLTAIGEVGIEFEGRSYLLRPSLFSMTQIGSPTEIVEATALLMTPEPEEPQARKLFRKQRFETALTVLYACSGEQDLGDLLGGMVPTESGRISYSPGRMPMSEIVLLARGLLRHGVVGDLEPTPRQGPGDYVREFRAEEHVSIAMAHLGLSEREAWNMTLSALVKVMRAKFPVDPKKANAPKPHTAEQYDATMERLKKINALRDGKK